MPRAIVVAHDSDSIREAIVRLLSDAGYRVTSVADGASALRQLDAHPDALVLDAALPGVLSFEVLEQLRTRSPSTKTVLIASVYNRAGYKRRPTSLYGADEYLEQHHIPDLLLAKLSKLLGLPMPDGEQVDAAVLRDTEAIRVGGEARLEIRYRTVEEGVLRAQRLARLIIADIALYNRALHPPLPSPGALAMGASTSRAPCDDPSVDVRLREDLDEGRLLFELRVPRALRGDVDYIGEALREYVEGRGLRFGSEGGRPGEQDRP